MSAGFPDRGKERERRGSLQLLPSRSAVRVGTSNPDPSCNVFGHSRCYKPSLTVEEVIEFVSVVLLLGFICDLNDFLYVCVCGCFILLIL